MEIRGGAGDDGPVMMWNWIRGYPAVATTIGVGLAGLLLLALGQQQGSAWLVGGYALVIAAWQAWSMVRELLRGTFGLDVLAVTAITVSYTHLHLVLHGAPRPRSELREDL